MLPWLFIAFALPIFVIRLMRTIRHVGELRMQSPPIDSRLRTRRPSDVFHDETWLPLCTRIATAAEARLGRPLTIKERKRIWRSRSPLILQTVLNEIEACADAPPVDALLASLPPGMDRPDPTRWCGEEPEC